MHLFVLLLILVQSLFCSIHGNTTPNVKITGSKGFGTTEVVKRKVQLENFNVADKKDIFEINEDLNLREGDLLSTNTKNGLADVSYYWPEGIVPLRYSPYLNLQALAVIEDARIEFEMRTCLKPVDWTTEQNYVYIDVRDGCYSYVGVQGGSQVLSLGSSCELMSIAQHELMHAIGIYHEQSRTDRDNYVVINEANVQSGQEHNFNKYYYNYVDDRRVPYDVNSVMHYDQYAFSSNGQPTISTRNPKFQDVIGQRRTFSVDDVTLMNRMYQCSEPSRYSYSCGFEDESVCGYAVFASDQPTWYRHVVGEASPSPSSAYFPTSDATIAENGRGSFLAFNTNYALGTISTMRMKSTVPKQCIEFSYFMNVASSSAGLGVFIGHLDSNTGETQLFIPIAALHNIQSSYWMTERITISAPSEYIISFQYESANEPNDVVAIDDVNILDKPCETGYFQVQGYQSILDYWNKGDYFYGPVLYTDDGYAFMLLIYPLGDTSASNGYMSIYFVLAVGENDDNLEWPFKNRFVKMSVVDQSPQILTRMNQYSNYVTSSDEGVWGKPTGSNLGWGYRDFMKISDITDTRSFLKNGAATFSVDVKDMNLWATSRKDGEYKRPLSDFMIQPNSRNMDGNLKPCPSDDEKNQISEEAAISIAAATVGVMVVLLFVAMLVINCYQQKKVSRLFKAVTRQNMEGHHNCDVNSKI